MQDVGEPPTLHWGGFQAAFGGAFRQPLGELSGSLKMGLRFVVSFGCGVYHALRASGALTFFASPKKVNKERRPRRAGLLRRLPSLRILFSARAN